MADIELVIKIPEEDFERCKKKFQMRLNVIAIAIAKGKPLPEGHGDLIDRNKLAHKMVIEDVSRFKGEPEALAGLFLRMCNKEQAIIEADKEDKE